MMYKIAILVDGGFYKKRARLLFGEKNPNERAVELINYCRRHLEDDAELYRIFYYDCPPSDKVIMHPLTGKNINLKKQININGQMNLLMN